MKVFDLEIKYRTALPRAVNSRYAADLRGVLDADHQRYIGSEIYNWSTEGFDTADLKEAKALLHGLTN